MAAAINRLFIPTRYFRQFQKKEILYKAKAPIKEEVNPEEILEKISTGEIQVMPKKL